MALTNFAALTSEQKTAWSLDFWKQARNLSFINQFAGKGANSMVQRVTELKKSEKGARGVVTLIPDLTGDGVTGDYTLENSEGSITALDRVIRIDQLRNANRLAGRLADQKSIVNFREQSRDVLAYWAADRLDQLAFLTLTGKRKNDDHAERDQAGGGRLGRHACRGQQPLHRQEHAQSKHDAGAEHRGCGLQEPVRLAEQLQQQVHPSREQDWIEHDEDQPGGCRFSEQRELHDRHGDVGRRRQPQQQSRLRQVLWTAPPEYDVEKCLQELQHVWKRRPEERRFYTQVTDPMREARLIQDPGELEAAVFRLRSADRLAIDTEFMRERTYHPKLCLVQIGTESDCFLVDPLAEINLAPLHELLGTKHPAPSPAPRTPHSALLISSPPSGTTYLIDPTLRPEFQTLSLRVEGAVGRVEWVLNGKPLGTSLAPSPLVWPLQRGQHTVAVRDASGRTAETRFVVK